MGCSIVGRGIDRWLEGHFRSECDDGEKSGTYKPPLTSTINIMAATTSKAKSSSSKAKPVRDPATENFFGRYISFTLKAEDAELTIVDPASFMLNALIQAFIKEYARVISDIMDASLKRTVSRKHVEQTTTIIFGNDMGASANKAGDTAVNNWIENKPEKAANPGTKANPNRAEKYAKIFLSVARVKSFLKIGLGMGNESGAKGSQGKHKRRLAPGATVFLSGVLQYVLAEILRSAGGYARASKKARIVPRHVKLAILGDGELAASVSRAHLVVSGGVAPAIHKVLLPAKAAKAAKE